MRIKMISKSIKYLTLVVMLLTLSIGTFAQSQGSTGTIVGVVTDSTGAAVPNATVTLTSKDTNSTKTVTTSDDGLYRFVLLPPGDYRVRASAASFGEQTLTITVQVGRTIDGNFTLGAKDVAAEVTVTTDGIQTTTSNSDAIVNETAIANTPINGRRFQDFATLTPGAQVSQDAGGTRGQISLSGQRGINANINVDGVDFSQPFFGGIRGGERSNQSFSIPQESIREFQVVAAGYSAEFGRSSGGIVNAVTKSGTNNFRGSAFYLLRPDKLARPNSFADALSEQRLSTLVINGVAGVDATLAPTQQQFGGSFGGPVIKDKLFFFTSYEQQIFRAPRQVFYGNLVGVTPSATQSSAFNFYRGIEVPYESTNDARALLGKVDWNISDAQRLSVRYNYSNNNALNAVATGETALDPTTNNSLSTNGTEKNRNHGVVSQLISTLNANTINELRFQYAYEQRPRIPNTLAANLNTTIGVYGTRNFLPTTQFDRRIQFADSLTFISGNHTMKFGAEASNLFADQTFGFNQTGVYSFAGLTQVLNNNVWQNVGDVSTLVNNSAQGTPGILQAISNTPYLYSAVNGTQAAPVTAFTTPYLGRFDTATARYAQQIGNLAAAYTVKELSFFAQDAWRVTPRFTLNYGLRYENQYNPSSENNNTAIVNLIKSTSFPILGNKGIDPSIIPDSRNQWGPRLGFAWDPKGDGKTVIRGFSGLYYARTPLLGLAGPFNNFRDPAGDLSVTIGSPAFLTGPGITFNQAAFEAANPQYVSIVGGTGFAPNTVFRQFAILGINLNSASLANLPTLTPAQLGTIAGRIGQFTTGAPASLGIYQNAAFTGITNDFRNPRSFQFGGGVEHEIMSGTTIGLDYSQVNTSFLQRNRDINLPGPLTGADYVAFLQQSNVAANFTALSTATNGFADILNSGRTFIGFVAPTGVPTNIQTTVNGVVVRAVTTRARPIAGLGAIQLRDSSARSNYRALTFRINMNKSWGRLNAFYTLSRSLSDDDNERDAGGVLYDNPYDLRPEYGKSNLDRRHQFVANPIFFLPFGFEVSSAVRIRSGRPFDSRVGADLNGDGLGNDRPVISPGVFLERNSFFNRPTFDVDLRVQKGFKLGESRRLSFSAEFFNVLNRSNLQFSGVQTTNYCAVSNQRCGLDGITNINFKQINNQTGVNTGKLNIGGLNPGSQVFQMQLGARFNF
jgi:Carboxypeptidase regulatory-like domain/TonB-dependent Receptor Plug Domain